MSRKGYKTEGIITHLRQAEVLTSQDQTIGRVSRALGVSERRACPVMGHRGNAERRLLGPQRHRGLRHGTDITITVDRQEIRLLSAHLKSGCFDDPLTDDSDACQKLNQQVPVLET